MLAGTYGHANAYAFTYRYTDTNPDPDAYSHANAYPNSHAHRAGGPTGSDAVCRGLATAQQGLRQYPVDDGRQYQFRKR